MKYKWNDDKFKVSEKENIYYELRDIALELNVFDMASTVLENEKFAVWPASSKHHHSYNGGLMIHTWEVINLCLANSEFLNTKLSRASIFLAGLYHDFGKIYDYQPNNENPTIFEDVPHKKLINHVAKSAMIFHEQATNYGFNVQQGNEIIHAILAHHGLPEWGSAVKPQSQLAWLLHLSDQMSARMVDLGLHK